jgi:hypothetical protein
MNWFRLYLEARNDAKLRTLTDAEHRVWFHLMCYSAEQPTRGTIEGVTSRDRRDTSPDLSSARLLAIEVANGDTAILTTTVEKLIELRIVSIDDDGLTFINFDKRQYDKPSDTPEKTRQRKAAQRERERAHNGEQGVTSRDEGVTPRDMSQRTEQNREEDIDGTASADAATDESQKNKRGTRFSPDATLTQEFIDVGTALNFPEERIAWEFDEFKDYWIGVPGSKGVKLDWVATFRNHLRRHIEQRGGLTPIRKLEPGQKSPDDWSHRKAVLA